MIFIIFINLIGYYYVILYFYFVIVIELIAFYILLKNLETLISFFFKQ